MSKKLDELKEKLNRPKPSGMKFAGLDVVVENPTGSIRSGKSKDGKPFAVRMKAPYGFIPEHNGSDGEGLDVFLGPNPYANDAYVIHTNDPATQRYDEDKVHLGFDSAEAAKQSFQDHYNHPHFYRSMTTIPMNSFKKQLTTEKPGSVKWTKKLRRQHKSEAMFSSDTENFEEGVWRTVGGHPGPEGKHTGGSHIEISDDEVIKGPPALKNKPIDDLKSKMKDIKPGVPQINSPKPSSAPAPKIIPNSQYDLKTGKSVSSQSTSQSVNVKPVTLPVEHPFFDKKINDVAKTDEDQETKWWNQPTQPKQGQPAIDQSDKNIMRQSHDSHKFGWGKLAQTGNANADKINQLAASKGITANAVQKMLQEKSNNSPQLAQQNLPSKNNSGTSGSAPINQSQDNPTPSSVNPPQLQPNIGAPKGPINDKPTNKSPEASTFYPPSKFFNQPASPSSPIGIPAQQNPQELLSSNPASGIQRITPDDFAKGWDGIEGWAGARDNPEHAENIAKGLNQLGDREHAVMQHSNGKHIIVSRPKQNPNQLSQTPPEEINPNTQIPNEEMQDQLGSTGAATPAINNPNEIKQQDNKTASQEPLFPEPEKTPAQQPLPEQEQNTGKLNDYSKASIERQLLDHFQKSGGNTEDQDERLTSAYHSPFTFRRTSKTKSGFPGEIDRALDGPDGKKLRRLLSLTDSPEGSQGEDLMGDLGEQGYIDLLNRKLSGKKNAQIQSAIDFAKKSGDPQMEFLAKLHEITPNRQDKKPVEIVDPKQLQVGEQATIHGIPVEIKEDEDGNKSVNDGGQSPNVPVESMNSLPIDKGSRKISEPEISNEPFAPEEKEPDNVEAKQEIEQNPNPENSQIESPQNNIEQETDSGIREENPEINKNEQRNNSNENINPPTESTKTNPSNQVGESEGENRSSESKSQTIPRTQPNPEKLNEQTKEKPTPQSSNSNNLQDKNENKNQEKTEEKSSKSSPESHKEMGKEKQDVGPSNSPQEEVKPISTSVETPKSNEIDKNWYGENGVKNLLKDARSGNESAIKEARSRGLAEYRTPQPKPRTYKPKWTSDEPRGTLSPEETEKQFNDIDNELIKFGFTKKESPSGSRYYENKNGQKIRVSDHDPNEATKQWIDREDVEEIRGNKRGAIDRVKDLIGENWSEQPVDISKQLGLYAKDKEGNPAEVGEKTGQSNLFNPNKYKGEEKPNEEKVKPQFRPEHTQEMFPEKKENKSPIDQLKDKMQKNKGSDYRVDENEGYVEVKRNGEVIASGVRQADGKIGDIQYKHPVHQKLNAIRNAVQRAINEHQEKQI